MTARGVVLVGVDVGHDDRVACEHDAYELAERLGGASLVSIHVVAEPEPHYAAAIELAGDVDRHIVDDVTRLADGCLVVVDDEPVDVTLRGGASVEALRSRRSGRVVMFPGDDELRGTIALADVVARSAIERVVCLGTSPGPDATLRTQDFVRPELRDGLLTLVIQPFDGVNEFVPFEQPNPHPCCGNH